MSPVKEVLTPGELLELERYQLITSLVVPRPIGWLSTRSADGVPNLAPYSFFNVLSVHPMLVGVSIGQKKSGMKDSLVNIRELGAFCLNIVSQELIEQMNDSSASVEPEVDEFALVGLTPVDSDRVAAPFVSKCKAVLECEVTQEVVLGGSNTLVVGEIVGIRLDPSLRKERGTRTIVSEDLNPVGRMGGSGYSIVDEVCRLVRPDSR